MALFRGLYDCTDSHNWEVDLEECENVMRAWLAPDLKECRGPEMTSMVCALLELARELSDGCLRLAIYCRFAGKSTFAKALTLTISCMDCLLLLQRRRSIDRFVRRTPMQQGQGPWSGLGWLPISREPRGTAWQCAERPCS